METNKCSMHDNSSLGKLKILHFTTDEKFMNAAYGIFEDVFPNQNDVIVFSYKKTNQYTHIKVPVSHNLRAIDLFRPGFTKMLKQYDCIFLHALNYPAVILALRAPSNTKLVWIGWGYEYYEYIYDKPKDMFLAKTWNVWQTLQSKFNASQNIVSLIKRIFWNRIEQYAIRKIQYFSPVFEEEYVAIKKAQKIKYLPSYVSWNYSNFEQNCAKVFKDIKVEGNGILIGNSATASNNHIEVFDLLNDLKIDTSRRILVPLSYGDNNYREIILQKGKEVLGKSFVPMLDFMPLEEYVNCLSSCGFVIMNHILQQGVGNTVIMMYLGAKIFLREECPTYQVFKKSNAVIFSVQELEQNPDLLNSRLTDKDVERNRQVLKRLYSRKVINEKTKNMVLRAIH